MKRVVGSLSARRGLVFTVVLSYWAGWLRGRPRQSSGATKTSGGLGDTVWLGERGAVVGSVVNLLQQGTSCASLHGEVLDIGVLSSESDALCAGDSL